MNHGPARRALATAPLHVTGFFSPALGSRDPRGRGSIGAGIVLDVAVQAQGRFDPRGHGGVRLSSDVDHRLEISEEAARRILGARAGRLEIHLRHALPLGQGFGTSAAGATASALAASRLVGRTRSEAIEVAHLADLFGRGGLGGVSAILGGGLEIRVRPGIPPFGRIVHEVVDGTFWIGILGGPIPSTSVLARRQFLEEDARVSESVDRLRANPTLDEFFRLSEEFTDRAALASPPLRRTLRALRRRGTWAAQAMFGQSFLARPRSRTAREEISRWLLGQGIPAIEVRAARRGARSAILPG